MRRLPSAALTTAALVLLCAPAAAAAPADVGAGECVAGGGMIVISAEDSGFTMRCSGGTHDGETVV
ncbi:hypothetical protein IGX29_27870 [Streptomyces sp. H28]|uniref:hypothetical protein n=1 Tax=Streptomyces sp. H28 TaxID=2775865 RepID=UPI0017831386|nr:hypothetical protein [Streptomyces sp. H28]MBD9735553.1 hypothetical protein [Streptomyces sp. H28]